MRKRKRKGKRKGKGKGKKNNSPLKTHSRSSSCWGVAAGPSQKDETIAPELTSEVEAELVPARAARSAEAGRERTRAPKCCQDCCAVSQKDIGGSESNG